MQQRPLGRTGRSVSAIGLGTRQLGADGGAASEEDSRAALAASVDLLRVTLFDTAHDDGDGRSESLIGRFLAQRPGHGITVATKMGRRVAQEPENYTPENFRAWTDRSRGNLGVDTLDLVQLHCPPTAVIEDAATYDALDALVAEGAIAAYGVSVETCAQALAAIARPNVANVQIIFNPFRLFAPRRGAARGRGGRRRDFRARSARLGAAVGQVHRRDHVRRERPPQL